MTSPAYAKRGSRAHTLLQAHVSTKDSFNFMGLCTEIRLLIYKEVFSEFYVPKPLHQMEEFDNDGKDSKTTSSIDGSNELVASDDRDSSGTFGEFGNSDSECDSVVAARSFGDRYRDPERVKLLAKLGIALASKTICAEALPILYETHHFNLVIREKIQCPIIPSKTPEGFRTYPHYFLRRNPMLVKHIKHLEVLFDLYYDLADALDSGAYLRTLRLLQDIAAACPTLETFRFATVEFPPDWIIDRHSRSDLRRDAAVACFRNFAQRGCRLELQVAMGSSRLEDFLKEFPPSDPQYGTRMIKDSDNSLYQWDMPDMQSPRVWSLEYRRSE